PDVLPHLLPILPLPTILGNLIPHSPPPIHLPDYFLRIFPLKTFPSPMLLPPFIIPIPLFFQLPILILLPLLIS
ncbi:GntT/GntP/DsdX family permease, partial [Priestia megaterium]